MSERLVSSDIFSGSQTGQGGREGEEISEQPEAEQGEEEPGLRARGSGAGQPRQPQPQPRPRGQQRRGGGHRHTLQGDNFSSLLPSALERLNHELMFRKCREAAAQLV